MEGFSVGAQQLLLLSVDVMSLILPSRQKWLPNNQHTLLLLVPYDAVGSLAPHLNPFCILPPT